MLVDDVVKKMETQMRKCIDVFRSELVKIRAGRFHPGLLDEIRINYYGTETPLKQIAGVNVLDNRTLVVAPYDKTALHDIEKAIMNSNLGLNPNTSGDSIRVTLPPLTVERRKELIKVVQQEAEKFRVAIRNVRRDAIANLKTGVQQKLITEDEQHNTSKDIQKMTDENIAAINTRLQQKEKDILED